MNINIGKCIDVGMREMHITIRVNLIPKMYLNQRSPGLFFNVDEKGGLLFI